MKKYFYWWWTDTFNFEHSWNFFPKVLLDFSSYSYISLRILIFLFVLPSYFISYLLTSNSFIQSWLFSICQFVCFPDHPKLNVNISQLPKSNTSLARGNRSIQEQEVSGKESEPEDRNERTRRSKRNWWKKQSSQTVINSLHLSNQLHQTKL